jgi:hypothetical protein
MNPVFLFPFDRTDLNSQKPSSSFEILMISFSIKLVLPISLCPESAVIETSVFIVDMIKEISSASHFA